MAVPSVRKPPPARPPAVADQCQIAQGKQAKRCRLRGRRGSPDGLAWAEVAHQRLEVIPSHLAVVVEVALLPRRAGRGAEVALQGQVVGGVHDPVVIRVSRLGVDQPRRGRARRAHVVGNRQEEVGHALEALGAGGPTEDAVREALQKLDPLWDELFPAEKERIVKLLVEEVVVSQDSLLIRLRLHGLNSLLAELAGADPAEGAGGRVVPGADGQFVLRSDSASPCVGFAEQGGPLRGVATVDIRVPMEFKTRSGRKEIISVGSPSGLPPDAATTADVGPRSALVVALARAYRWQRMIDTGEVASLDELAVRYDVDRSYVGRILKLAGLAPDLVTAVLGGRVPEGPALRRLPNLLPILWSKQRQMLSCDDVTVPTM